MNVVMVSVYLAILSLIAAVYVYPLVVLYRHGMLRYLADVPPGVLMIVLPVFTFELAVLHTVKREVGLERYGD